MISLKGMIIRCSSIIPEIREAVFKCLICGYCTDPVVVDRGIAGMYYYCFWMLIACSINTDHFSFSLIFSYHLGRITEPTVCVKEDCGAKNSMSMIHNRCRWLFFSKLLVLSHSVVSHYAIAVQFLALKICKFFLVIVLWFGKFYT